MRHCVRVVVKKNVASLVCLVRKAWVQNWFSISNFSVDHFCFCFVVLGVLGSIPSSAKLEDIDSDIMDERSHGEITCLFTLCIPLLSDGAKILKTTY